MRKITPRIEKAIDVFLDAINNGTLAKGTCTACAVGNLAAKAINYTCKVEEVNYLSPPPNSYWAALFCTDYGVQRSFRNKQLIRAKEGVDINKQILLAEELISKTEFSEEELMKIEFAFETNTMIDFREYNLYTKEEIRKDQINGLKAVIEVMMTFDGCKEQTVDEVFTSKAELIPIN